MYSFVPIYPVYLSKVLLRIFLKEKPFSNIRRVDQNIFIVYYIPESNSQVTAVVLNVSMYLSSGIWQNTSRWTSINAFERQPLNKFRMNDISDNNKTIMCYKTCSLAT